MERDELTDSLSQRVRQFHDDGDTASVTEFATLEQTMALVGMTLGAYDATGELDTAAFSVIVEVFAARAQAVDDDERRAGEWAMLTSLARHVALALPADVLEALGITVASEAELAARYQNVVAQLVRAEAGEQIPIGDAVMELREIIQQLPPDSPRLPAVLSNLGATLRMRYEATGNQDDLMYALDAGRISAGLGAAHSELSGHGLHQFNYGWTAWLVYQRTGDLVYAQTAATAYRAAQGALPRNDPNRKGCGSSGVT